MRGLLQLLAGHPPPADGPGRAGVQQASRGGRDRFPPGLSASEPVLPTASRVPPQPGKLSCLGYWDAGAEWEPEGGRRRGSVSAGFPRGLSGVGGGNMGRASRGLSSGAALGPWGSSVTSLSTVPSSDREREKPLWLTQGRCDRKGSVREGAFTALRHCLLCPLEGPSSTRLICWAWAASPSSHGPWRKKGAAHSGG